MRSMKNVAVFTEDEAFALFFCPHPGGFDSSRVPTPGNLPSKAKKVPVPGGQPRWALGTAGIDACIKNKLCKLYRYVLSHQVGFLCLFGLKTGIDFAHFGLELGMVFEGTTGRYEHIYCFSSRWVRKKEKCANSNWIWSFVFVYAQILVLNDDKIFASRPGLKTGIDFRGLV